MKKYGGSYKLLFENTPAFEETYRYRAGVEATMSEFDCRTGVKHFRVRGMKAVTFAAVMKAIGLNILRAGRARARNTNQHGPLCGALTACMSFSGYIKEQLKRIFCRQAFSATIWPPGRADRLGWQI